MLIQRSHLNLNFKVTDFFPFIQPENETVILKEEATKGRNLKERKTQEN